MRRWRWRSHEREGSRVCVVRRCRCFRQKLCEVAHVAFGRPQDFVTGVFAPSFGLGLWIVCPPRLLIGALWRHGLNRADTCWRMTRIIMGAHDVYSTIVSWSNTLLAIVAPYRTFLLLSHSFLSWPIFSFSHHRSSSSVSSMPLYLSQSTLLLSNDHPTTIHVPPPRPAPARLVRPLPRPSQLQFSNASGTGLSASACLPPAPHLVSRHCERVHVSRSSYAEPALRAKIERARIKCLAQPVVYFPRS